MEIKVVMPNFIMFFGPEGVGKSTQAKLLIRWLRTRGVRTRNVWVRSNQLFSYILSELIIKLGRYTYEIFPNGARLKQLDVNFVRRLKLLWLSTVVLSVLVKALLTAVIPYHLGYVIVAERYLLDKIADLFVFNRVSLNMSRETLILITRILFRFIPRNSLLIVFEADYASLEERYLQRNDGFVYSEAHTSSFIRFGRIFSKIFTSKVIDTTGNTITDTHKEIVQFIQDKMTSIPI